MNCRRLQSFLLLFAILASPMLSRAEPLPSLVREFEDQLRIASHAVEGGSVADAEAEEAWFFRRFWLRIRPKVAFEIPWAVKLEIVPETELLWQRDLPTGWKSFKP